ncbi:MAG: hypothetical protein J3K34DRAFT_410840 [Monoraphidium minutum]|nr:MAG: hypothetical protein J3K34DRAFT_410840 [Monoraphidium minutum]
MRLLELTASSRCPSSIAAASLVLAVARSLREIATVSDRPGADRAGPALGRPPGPAAAAGGCVGNGLPHAPLPVPAQSARAPSAGGASHRCRGSKGGHAGPTLPARAAPMAAAHPGSTAFMPAGARWGGVPGRAHMARCGRLGVLCCSAADARGIAPGGGRAPRTSRACVCPSSRLHSHQIARVGFYSAPRTRWRRGDAVRKW